MKRLEGKVAIITGAARGIGNATALKFAEEGAKVARVDILKENYPQPPLERPRHVTDTIIICADITDTAKINRIVSETLNRFGRVDILVNNAGMGGSKGCFETSEDDWERMLRTNLTSVFLICQKVLPIMVEQGKGKIINIASMYGLLGSPKAPAYCASKAGVINLTRQLAVDFTPKNICVNSISPGLIETDMTKHKLDTPGRRDKFVQHIPIGRNGTPADIAAACLFLASDDSDFISGHNLVVDGGQSCKVL